MTENVLLTIIVGLTISNTLGGITWIIYADWKEKRDDRMREKYYEFLVNSNDKDRNG